MLNTRIAPTEPVETELTASEEPRVVNGLFRQATDVLEDFMGVNGTNVVLREAGLERFVGHKPPNDLVLGGLAKEYAHLNEAIEHFYGRAGKGMLRRIGRASFRWSVREQASVLGIAGMALKLLPSKMRTKLIWSGIAGALMRTNPDARIEVLEQNDQLRFVDHTCSICYERQSSEPICYLLQGTLAEALEWATGEMIPVEETSCRAKGDPACAFSAT